MKVLSIVCLLFVSLPNGTFGQSSHFSDVATFSRSDEIVAGWNAEQKLWTSGRLPVSAQQLQNLESWLDANAPNWTVVLMQNARGQQYNGRRGMDAVEFSLGQQLSNQSAFGDLVDARTGEANGAIFVLFLEERKFSYFSSKAMDSRRLGHARWVGDLDKPAIRAMRNGGRIVDAVKDTISNIEDRLTRQIESEVAAKKRAALQRQQAIAEAKRLPEKITQLIDAVEGDTAEFKTENPEVEGELVDLNSEAWRANVRAIEIFAEGNDAQQAHSLASKTESEIRRFRAGLEGWEKAKADLDDLDQKIEAASIDPEAQAAMGLLARSTESARAARENHRSGDPIYRDQIETGQNLVAQAEREFSLWKAAIAAEKQRLETRRKIIQGSILAAILLLIIGLIVANRMRAPNRKEAWKLFENWRSQLSGKFDQLFGLMDRANLLVGPSVGLKDRGFSGTTLKLCREAIREVDELFIMSSATDQVMGKVENLINPGNIFAKLLNAFSSVRYRKAIDLISADPIGFEHDDGLHEIIAPADRELLGEPGDYAPFQLSFEKLVEIYDDKQDDAKATIERLGAGIDGLPLATEKAASRLEILVSEQISCETNSADDGFFPLTKIRTYLIPQITTNLEKAGSQSGKSDPVTALEGPVSEAQRQLAEGFRLTDAVHKTREKDFPEVQGIAADLEALDRDIRWIDAAYASLSGHSEQLAELATDRSVVEELDEFETDLLRTMGRIRKTGAQSKQASEEWPDKIEACQQSVDDARSSLAEMIGVPENAIFFEPRLSPDDRLASARNELATACSAMNHGNIEAVSEDFSEIEVLLEEAGDLVAQSLNIAENHAAVHSSLLEKAASLRAAVPERQALMTDFSSHYDSAVLLFSQRFGTEPQGRDTIEGAVERAGTRLDSGEDALSESMDCFKKGHLIHAGVLCERAGNELGVSEHQLALIADQHAALKAAEKENAANFKSAQEEAAAISGRIEDPRTMEETRAEFFETVRLLEKIGADRNAAKPNPFQESHDLEQVGRQFEKAEQGVAADWQSHQTAVAAINDARNALDQSNHLIHRAKTDQIPDSAALSKAISHHQALADFVQKSDAYLDSPHGNWPSMHQKAVSVAADAMAVRGLMDRELEAAQKAAREIQAAARAISNLRSWRSQYRIRLNENRGAQEYQQAYNALARGDYGQANNLALASHRSAVAELRKAKDREARQKRAEEAERMRAAFASSSSNNSSSFGSSSGGGSSGFSSSSFSSSSSGFSRSGW